LAVTRSLPTLLHLSWAMKRRVAMNLRRTNQEEEEKLKNRTFDRRLKKEREKQSGWVSEQIEA
jgi:hypothetical protein